MPGVVDGSEALRFLANVNDVSASLASVCCCSSWNRREFKGTVFFSL